MDCFNWNIHFYFFYLDKNKYIFRIDIITILFSLTLFTNGMLRILCTSRRLNIAKKFITAFISLIPIINIFAMLYACHIAAMEYNHECYKVNIIAHSKGELDARYMISKLDMDKYVASLTMMSSPHRGCKFVDTACKIPDKIYKTVAEFFNKYYRILGDKNPDFYTASRQFSTYHSMNFNKEVTDIPGVYYQSYASAVKNIFSDYVVSIPYIFSKLAAGENDGLVAIDSAKWGDFKGVLRNNHIRGISHGDIIDLRREDYKGFDVLEKYVEIVSELKNKEF